MIVLNEILRYIGPVLLLLNLILYLRSHNSKTRIMAFKVFVIYLIVSFIVLILSTILYEIGENNIYLSHAYFTTQFILLSFFYYLLLESKQRLVVKYLFIIILLTIGITYTIKPENLLKFSLYEVFFTSFPLILYSIFHLYNSLTKKGKFMFINAAVLIYLSSSTLIFFLGNFLTGLDKQLTLNIWLIHKILYVIFLVLIFFEWKLHISQYKRQAL